MENTQNKKTMKHKKFFFIATLALLFCGGAGANWNACDGAGNPENETKSDKEPIFFICVDAKNDHKPISVMNMFSYKYSSGKCHVDEKQQAKAHQWCTTTIARATGKSTKLLKRVDLKLGASANSGVDLGQYGVTQGELVTQFGNLALSFLGAPTHTGELARVGIDYYAGLRRLRSDNYHSSESHSHNYYQNMGVI